jgi:hypothetical protein
MLEELFDSNITTAQIRVHELAVTNIIVDGHFVGPNQRPCDCAERH